MPNIGELLIVSHLTIPSGQYPALADVGKSETHQVFAIANVFRSADDIPVGGGVKISAQGVEQAAIN
jgi:hypothetical protein